MPDPKMLYKPLTNAEIKELLSATLRGPLPMQTMSRVFATLAATAELREAAEEMLKNCYPCAGTGKLCSDFDFDSEDGACGSCYKLREAFTKDQG